MMSISATSMSGIALEDRDALRRPRSAWSTSAPVRLEHAGERVDVANVVVDDEQRRAVSSSVPVSARAPSARASGFAAPALARKDLGDRSNSRAARRGLPAFSITCVAPSVSACAACSAPEIT
jgi:hypothetical protein